MVMDETALVLTEVHSADVVELSLNRVGALNALSTGFVREIYESVARARDLDPVVLVVTSRCERAFSVGADLKERSAMSAADLLDCRADFAAAYQSLLELPFPVVCAINGFAVGGGFELALTCDVIVADETAVVALPEVTIGLIPGGGGSQLLGRRAGWGAAADLVLTGRRVGAEEARRLGIVDRLVEPGHARAAAIEIATQIAAGSPAALVLAKRALRDGASVGLKEGLAIEDSLWRRAAASPDREEGIRAFMEKRPPSWPSHSRG
jgi:enoyl-CoA hydratase/carnithine racemase